MAHFPSIPLLPANSKPEDRSGLVILLVLILSPSTVSAHLFIILL